MIEVTQDIIEECQEIPMLDAWKPSKDQVFVEFKGDYIQAHFEKQIVSFVFSSSRSYIIKHVQMISVTS